MRHAMVAAVLAMTTSMDGLAQAPAPSAGPTFDVVSIRQNAGGNFSGSVGERPDGGLNLVGVSVGTLIARAYPPHVPIDIAGLPEWASKERYDVSATSALAMASADDRVAMMRHLLADRFGLVVHVEDRVHDVFDLVLAREDGRLGPGLQQLSGVDCAAVYAERDKARAAALVSGAPSPDLRIEPKGPMPPCTLRLAFTLMEAQATMPELALAFTRMATSPRHVVDKTGLTGSYSVRLEFDPVATRRGPDVNAPTGSTLPTLFTAVQEQLGLRLVSSRATRPTLVVDRVERPREN